MPPEPITRQRTRSRPVGHPGADGSRRPVAGMPGGSGRHLGKDGTMPVWVWILIAIAVLVVLGAAAWLAWSRRRTQGLRDRFGPEYDRVVDESPDRRRAESELDARRKRREELDIRP